jgi:hypothetical protein
MPFVKLDCGILDSSIWAEDSDTVKIWITLLTMSDATGLVRATAPGISIRSQLPRDLVIRVLTKFESPDPASRSIAHEGRRIQRVDGGYKILNYLKYRGSWSQSYVYYIRLDGRIKIGFSLNPWARIAEMRTNHPGAQLLAIERGDSHRAIERQEQFWKDHVDVTNDWYRESPGLSALIKSLGVEEPFEGGSSVAATPVPTVVPAPTTVVPASTTEQSVTATVQTTVATKKQKQKQKEKKNLLVASLVTETLSTDVDLSPVFPPENFELTAPGKDPEPEDPESEPVPGPGQDQAMEPDHRGRRDRDAVFEHWQRVMQKRHAHFDPKRKRVIDARLAEGYTVADLCRAIDGCRMSRWHQGANDRGRVYDDLELICRDARHVEQFVELSEPSRALPPMSPLSEHNRRALGLPLPGAVTQAAPQVSVLTNWFCDELDTLDTRSTTDLPGPFDAGLTVSQRTLRTR